MQRIGRIAVVSACAAVVAFGLTACSGDSSAAPANPNPNRECTADDIKTTGNFGEAPTITIPDDCTPPKKLITKDLSTGTGPVAAQGAKLSMNYSLVTWSDKKKLDSSFDRGQPFTLTLGAGEVIKGWDQGLAGIKQGTRRLLIVPPDLGYGQGGRGIAPNETLVFVTDAVAVS
ncbi:FKBP-type peptidyl-prolyl cis-trans isomerase [Amycolatopsis benzoatilytica]|uniref:FKBP-type peptidyl-prolyl cis-trans isomerase n=1 Tax=Amycolatopsis benzoatilytica TaxID=346045 RepID=UPI00037D5919|nr:FKBP-type peptidyl-prolyl cis-trans isomerase [Amycolatopsis benzoatilytica]